MENDYEPERCYDNVFRSFVCVVLSMLLGMQVYSYYSSSQDGLNGDFTDVKYVMMQLSRGLSEVNRKHEKLQGDIERLSESLPTVAAAAGRAKEALGPARFGGRQAVGVYDYDRQAADYALETAGARVIDTGDTVEHYVYESPVGWILYAFSSELCRGCLGASTMIRPGALPGECWAFKGSKGEATIRLIGTVHITGVSLEHISAHISPTGEISSAPRLFQLQGFESRGDSNPHEFGTFEYDRRGKPNQHFEVLYPTTRCYNLVRLRILSNWGHPVYTCVYRLRVHGHLVVDDTTIKDEEELRIDNE